MSHFLTAVFVENRFVEQGRLEERISNLMMFYDEGREVDYTIPKEKLIQKNKDHVKQLEKTVFVEYMKDPEKYMENANDRQKEFIEHIFPKMLKYTDEEHYQEAIKYVEEEDILPDGSVHSTYNPNSKWDWYVIGGRWENNLPLKNGEYANYAPLKDINFDVDERKYKEFLRMWDVLSGDTTPETEEEEAALLYGGKNRLKRYKQEYKTRENYARQNAIFKPFAFVDSSAKWHEKGEMGWFGTSTESDDSRKDYDLAWEKALKEHTNHTLVVVDCHI